MPKYVVNKTFIKKVQDQSKQLPEFQLYRIRNKICQGKKYSTVTMMNGDVYYGFYKDILKLLAKRIVNNAQHGIFN